MRLSLDDSHCGVQGELGSNHIESQQMSCAQTSDVLIAGLAVNCQLCKNFGGSEVSPANMHTNYSKPPNLSLLLHPQHHHFFALPRSTGREPVLL